MTERKNFKTIDELIGVLGQAAGESPTYQRIAIYIEKNYLRVVFMKGTWRVYHITFWLDRNEQQERCLYIGALQGSLGGRASIQALTKKFFGCRPKNLMTGSSNTCSRCAIVSASSWQSTASRSSIKAVSPTASPAASSSSISGLKDWLR